MHSSLEQYLEFLRMKRRTPATLKVIRHGLTHFITWWESTRRRTFDPAFLRHGLLGPPTKFTTLSSSLSHELTESVSFTHFIDLLSGFPHGAKHLGMLPPLR
jgi:hypothetical protein